MLFNAHYAGIIGASLAPCSPVRGFMRANHKYVAVKTLCTFFSTARAPPNPLLLLLLLLLLLATMTLNQVQSFRINHQAGSYYINI